MTEHTYNLATRLRAIACDSLHTFQPGRRTLTAEDLPDIFVTARFATHPWGISAQLWARNSAAALLASAEATAPRRRARLDHLAYQAFPLREPAVDSHIGVAARHRHHMRRLLHRGWTSLLPAARPTAR